MRLRLKEDPREWRKFAWALAGATLTLATLLVWRGRVGVESALILGALGGLAAAWGTISPRAFRRPYRVAMTGAHHVGQVMGRIMITLIFCLGLVPLGLLLRLLGRDVLDLRRSRDAGSFWKDARPPGPLDRLS